MTLDTAALVLTVTFIEKGFAQPLWRTAVGVAVGAFLTSLIAGGLAQLVLLGTRPRVGASRMSSTDRGAALGSAAATFAGFAAGVVALVGFFFANWFR